ncbi:HPP family protein [Noviherbaspirillum pedocola]|uniref:HPP family protein n=1 Tax=Noviherbaspirillum pedocola TaxID=2801341 RepID=A0A934T2Z4_9BURK|nr:HPP family protein [Noviherbaspirillum pedocola]MBK4737273.1 HPP family protein [Noviherbaspirillum pedocola]
MTRTLREDSILWLLLPIAYLSALSKGSAVTGATFLMFPELAALAFDMFAKPDGAWAKSPAMVAITPVLTALCGIGIARLLPYGPWSIALCIASALLVIRVLQSPVAPAISAAVLPLSLGVTSWSYPPSIGIGTVGLACLSMLTRHFRVTKPEKAPSLSIDEKGDETRQPRHRYGWAAVFVAFIAIAYTTGQATGMRFILFPPLVVVAYVMLAHADVCPWAQRPLALPLACTIAAAAGVCVVGLLDPGPVSVAIAMAAAIASVRALRVHVPPAIAVSLLPQVIDQPDWHFIVAVAVGTVLLTAIFLAVRASRLGIVRESKIAPSR